MYIYIYRGRCEQISAGVPSALRLARWVCVSKRCTVLHSLCVAEKDALHFGLCTNKSKHRLCGCNVRIGIHPFHTYILYVYIYIIELQFIKEKSCRQVFHPKIIKRFIILVHTHLTDCKTTEYMYVCVFMVYEHFWALISFSLVCSRKKI